MKKIVLSVVLFISASFSFGQCAYLGTPLTQAGSTVSFCIDNTNTQSVTLVNSGQYVLVNVISGFNYTFSVGDVFAGSNENLTLLNASTNSNVAPSAFNSAAAGASITWTSTLSGQIKVLLSSGSCVNNNTAGGAISCKLNAVDRKSVV